MVKKSLVASLLVAMGITQAVADVNIPVVPASVMVEDVPRPTTRIATQNEQTDTGTTINKSTHLTVKPGVNEIVPVAIDHLNRIVTPFSTPAVETVSGATTNIKDNVVYVGTDNETPVTLFITEKGSQAVAVSLTLLPQKIPPRELFIEVDGALANPAFAGSNKAEKWETSQPYVDTIRDLLRGVALGTTPQGYTLHTMEPGIPVPHCAQPGMEFDFRNGQIMMGHKLSVSIGVARNVSGQPLEFREAACGDWDVAAVAAWPRSVLSPNERTEVYVIKRQGERQASSTTRRPSLLGGSAQ
ncbi:conjugal transfer pilus assembly protein TraK [Modicisalibacter xianhensis]|uniref:Conjugal transfer pilus assembly protein TraK n=1 Tax=Modicisalibacter xianhensis TaxID=442341 RepID=A0A4R8FRS6_9GAMM|nr:type-F conjugative transfer system secretin TraK [Halomonas xianhensis]TDX26808.1 conjugal transfer pilus assembly protein TraK [Halomonas xianhensis]